MFTFNHLYGTCPIDTFTFYISKSVNYFYHLDELVRPIDTFTFIILHFEFYI